MKQSVSKSTLIYLLPLLILLYPAYVLSEAPPQDTSDNFSPAGQIKISSDKLEIDDKLNLITFTGNVLAKRDTLTIDCQEILLHYKKDNDKTDSQKASTGIEKIIATGKVKISRSDGSIAMADKAVYYQEIDKLVLTGKPVIQQGNNFVEGKSITLFLKENRSIVENAKAVLYSPTEEGNLLDR